jgi:hypothetical protein
LKGKGRGAADKNSLACTLEFSLAPGETVSLSTSGSYERFREAGGKRLSHVFDPRTGFPVETSLLSVSVIDPCSARADALATAFLTMGEKKARELLASHFPSTEALFLRLSSARESSAHEPNGRANEKITASFTEGLRKRLKFPTLTDEE